MGLSSLALFGCTDEGQQPKASIWMSAVCPNGRENGKGEIGMYVGRRERKERERGHLVHLCVCVA